MLPPVTCTTSAAAFRRRTRSPRSRFGPCVVAFEHSKRGGRLVVGWQLCKPFLSLWRFMVCNARFVVLLVRSVKCRFWPFYLGNTSKAERPLLRVRVPSVTPLFIRKQARFKFGWQMLAVFYSRLNHRQAPGFCFANKHKPDDNRLATFSSSFHSIPMACAIA